MKYICSICGYIYDEEKEKVKFEELPNDWKCPLCGAPKNLFKLIEDNSNKENENKNEIEEDLIKNQEQIDDDMKELSIGQLSILCSNLAKGCEKQYKPEEERLFKKLAKYLEDKTPKEEKNDLNSILNMLQTDINEIYPNTKTVIEEKKDRGSNRACTWSEKVTRIINSLLTLYEKQGEKMFEGKEIWICTVCGFIYVGNKLPDRCPVCKVQKNKFQKIDGRVQI